MRLIVIAMMLVSSSAAADDLAGAWSRSVSKFAAHSGHTCGGPDGEMIDGREGWTLTTSFELEPDRYTLRVQHRIWHGCGSTETTAVETGTWTSRGATLTLRPSRLERTGKPPITRRLPARRHAIRRENRTLLVKGACPPILRRDPGCGKLVFSR